MKTLLTTIILAITSVCFAASPTLTLPTTENTGASMTTLVLQSSGTGTGYFTLLSGNDTACGSGTQVKAGQDSSGSAAPYHGSLQLVASTGGRYTVRNLTQNTSYTVCFTAESPTGLDLQETPTSINLTTAFASVYSNPAWGVVGNAGFTVDGVQFTSLAFAPDGTPYLAYQDQDSGFKVTVMKYSAGNWNVVGSAGFSAGQANSTSLAFAPDGTPYVAYSDEATDVRYKATVKKFNGMDWVTVGNAGFTANAAWSVSLVIAPDGSPHIAYSDASSSNIISVMKFDGTNWSVVGSSGTFVLQDDYRPSLAIAPDGTSYVAYKDLGNVKMFDGVNWVNVDSTGFSAGQEDYLSMAIAPNGTPYVAYSDGGASNKATVMKYSEGAWSVVGARGFSVGRAMYTSLAIGPDGTPYVVYMDYGNSYKSTVMRYSDNAWSVIGSAGFSTGSAEFTSLAFALDGTPYVAYSDGGNSYKATVMKLNAIPSAPVAAAASVISNTGFTANWGAAANATSYSLDVSTDATFATFVGTGAINNLNMGNVTSHAVADLTFGTTYYYRVRAINGSLFSGYSNVISALTTSTAATMLTPANASVLSGASQTFTWNNAGAGQYVVWVGTTVGGNDIVAYPAGGTVDTTITLSGIPTNGSTLYVRLYSAFGSTWIYNDYVYSAAGTQTAAVMTTPTSNAVLAGDSQNFAWNSVGAALYVVWIGTTPGGNDIVSYPAGGTTATNITLSGLPTNGRTLYVRLYSAFGSSWVYNDYTYTAVGTQSAAGMQTPANNTALSGASQAFTWNNVGAGLYVVWVGTTPGGNDIVAYPAGGTTATSITLSGLPTNGSTLHVRLWSAFGATWVSNDYTYTAAGTQAAAVMATPANNTVLAGASQNFSWNNVGAGLYVVWVGTTPGGNDLVAYPAGGTTATNITLSGLPTNGSTLYVRLWSAFGGTWVFNDYTYTAAGTPAAAVMQTPLNNSVLGTSQTFSWNNVGANLYVVWVGTTPGGNDIVAYPAGGTTATSITLNGLPVGSIPLYVRLHSAFGPTWLSNDYVYTSAP